MPNQEMIGFILDNDGVIVESEPLHYEARRIALAELGITLSKEEYIQKGISRHHREFLKAVCPQEILSPEKYDDFFYNKIQPLYKELRSSKLDLVSGFKEMLLRLLGSPIVFAVASTQPEEVVKSGIQSTLKELAPFLFTRIISGEDVKRNKPYPDVYLRAIEVIGIAPRRCVALEDSVSGVRSAKAAGIHCLARKNEWADSIELCEAGTDFLLSDYNQINFGFLEQLLTLKK